MHFIPASNNTYDIGRSDTRVTLIGEIIAGDDVEFMSSVEGGIDADGKAYTHFSPERR